MTYLEASRFKALNIMMDLESRPRVTHSLSSYIDYSKDKQGLTAATLKIPSWVRTEPLPPTPQIDLPPLPGKIERPIKGFDRGAELKRLNHRAKIVMFNGFTLLPTLLTGKKM